MNEFNVNQAMAGNRPTATAPMPITDRPWERRPWLNRTGTAMDHTRGWNVRGILWTIAAAIGILLAAMVICSLGGCSAIPTASHIVPPPRTPQLSPPLNTITHWLTLFNILSVLGLALGVGALFTPISSISKVIIPVSGALAAISLLGIVTIPFAKPIGIAFLILTGLFALYEIVVKIMGSKTISGSYGTAISGFVSMAKTDVEKLM